MCDRQRYKLVELPVIQVYLLSCQVFNEYSLYPWTVLVFQVLVGLHPCCSCLPPSRLLANHRETDPRHPASRSGSRHWRNPWDSWREEYSLALCVSTLRYWNASWRWAVKRNLKEKKICLYLSWIISHSLSCIDHIGTNVFMIRLGWEVLWSCMFVCVCVEFIQEETWSASQLCSAPWKHGQESL